MIPFVGASCVHVLKPVFAVGLLAAAWTQERGGRPRCRTCSRASEPNLRALLPLGLVLVAGIAAASSPTSLFDGGALLELVQRRIDAAAEARRREGRRSARWRR